MPSSSRHTPRLSVIIPVYRVEIYLHECVDSVLRQSYRNLEVILVDDGSPDSSPQICDEYAAQDPRVKVIHKENGGLSDARNFGLRAATGDYVIFLDSDDYWGEGDAMARAVAILDNNPTIDLLYFDCTRLSNTGRSTNPPLDTSKINGKDKLEIISYLIEEDRFFVTAWSKFIKREIITNNKLSFKKDLLSEDYDWNFWITIYSRTLWVMDSNFYIYRQREGSIISNMSTKHLFDIWSIITDWYEKIPTLAPTSREAELYLDFLG